MGLYIIRGRSQTILTSFCLCTTPYVIFTRIQTKCFIAYVVASDVNNWFSDIFVTETTSGWLLPYILSSSCPRKSHVALSKSLFRMQIKRAKLNHKFYLLFQNFWWEVWRDTYQFQKDTSLWLPILFRNRRWTPIRR